MDAKKFVEALRKNAIEDDNRIYQSQLDTLSNPKDPIWRDAISIYRALDKNNKIVFLQFLRLIQINTLSHVLGVLDGSTTLVENGENFILKTQESDQVINGYLQDILWEIEEEM